MYFNVIYPSSMLCGYMAVGQIDLEKFLKELLIYFKFSFSNMKYNPPQTKIPCKL
jgi:hypothetical protein